MSGARVWPIWLIFAGVFLAGGVTGGFISLRIVKSVVKDGRAPDQFAPRMMERLSDGLELTEEQRASIQPLVDSTWEDLRLSRRESVEAMRAMEAAISAILTPEQEITYDKMQERQRAHWTKMTERRGPRRREGDEKPRKGLPKPTSSESPQP